MMGRVYKYKSYDNGDEKHSILYTGNNFEEVLNLLNTIMYGYKSENLKYLEFRDSIAKDCDTYMLVQDPTDNTWYNVYIGDVIVIKYKDSKDEYNIKIKNF